MLITLVNIKLIQYDKNWPKVIRKPFILIKAPLIRAGEASDIYNGAVIDAIPTPNPTKTRPTTITAGTGAAAITIEPKKNSKSAVKIVFFRPMLSFIHAPIAAPKIAAPTAILTISSCNQVCLSTDSKSSRIYNNAPEITPRTKKRNIYISHNENKNNN